MMSFCLLFFFSYLGLLTTFSSPAHPFPASRYRHLCRALASRQAAPTRLSALLQHLDPGRSWNIYHHIDTTFPLPHEELCTLLITSHPPTHANTCFPTYLHLRLYFGCRSLNGETVCLPSRWSPHISVRDPCEFSHTPMHVWFENCGF